MARKNESPDDVVARGTEDVALQLQGQTVTRDALVDPRPGDYIPDAESKGFHVGTVRQPAEPVLTRGGDVRFESVDGGESKFETAADQKARSNEREAANPSLYGGVTHVPFSVNESDVVGAGSADRVRRAGIEVTPTASATGDVKPDGE